MTQWHHFVPRGDGVGNCKLCHMEENAGVHNIHARLSKLEAEQDQLKAESNISNRLIREAWAERDALLKQRDEAMEWADKLAYACFTIEDIGEHTNLNQPWENAYRMLVGLKSELNALRDTMATLRQILDDCDYMPLEAVELIDAALALKEQAK